MLALTGWTLICMFNGNADSVTMIMFLEACSQYMGTLQHISGRMIPIVMQIKTARFFLVNIS